MVTGFKQRIVAMLLATSSLCVPAIARAQIVAADGSTTVYTNPNGVPVVDIAAPNGGGLSHNRFDQYNVDNRGVVLNNGTTDVNARQSQLAGQVLANTRLGETAAKVILNEVVSNNRTTLAGFTEVLGSKADVIVANPYGITCGGCGFLNAPNVVLTTGRPQFGADGTLTGFAVTGGDILVNGTGLNATGQDYLALVARRVSLQAPLNGNAVDLIGGANDFNLATRTATARTGADTTPLYAIDSSALGGAYTNRIRLIVTESGAGVRMAGDMAASAGDFTLDAGGQVELSGALSAAGAVRLATGGAGLTLSGASTTAGGAMSLSAVNGALTLTGGTITAGQSLTVAAARLLDGPASSAGRRFARTGIGMTVTGAAVIDGAAWSSDAGMVAQLESLAMTSGTLAGATLDLRSTGDLALGVAALRSIGTLTLNAGGTLGIGGALQSTNGNVALAGTSGIANGGTVSVDRGALSLTAGGTLANTGTLNAATGMTVTAAAVDSAGTLIAGGPLSVTTAALGNRGTIQSGTTARLNATALTNAGTISGASGVGITAGTVANAAAGVLQSASGAVELIGARTLTNDGRIIAATDLTVTGTPAVTNTAGGLVQAGGTLAIDGGALTQAGKILGSQVTLAVTNGGNAGVIQGERALALTATGDFANSGLLLGRATATVGAGGAFGNSGTVSGDSVALTATTLDNRGTVQAGTRLTASAGSLANSGGLGADGEVTLAVAALTNATSGTIKSANGDVTLSGARTIGNDGLMVAAGDLRMASLSGARVDLTNGANGALKAGGLLAITGGGTLAQAGGLIARTIGLDFASGANTGLVQARGEFGAVFAGAFDNRGEIAGEAGTRLTAGALTNEGTLRGGVLALGAASISNTGAITSGAAATLAVSGVVTNVGTLFATGTLDVRAAKLVNAQFGGIQGSAGTVLTAAAIDNAGQIVATSAASGRGLLDATTLVNSGSIRSAGTLGVLLSGALDNSGTLLAQDALAIDARSGSSVAITNRGDAGVIQAGTALTIGAAAQTGALSLAVEGGRVSGADLNARLARFGNAGLVQATRNLALTVGTGSNAGSMLAGGTLGLDASTFANSGLIQSDGGATLGIGELTNSGRIYAISAAGLSLTVDRLANLAGGALYSAGSLSLAGGSRADNAGRILAAGDVTVTAAPGIALAFANVLGAELRAGGALAFLSDAAGARIALAQHGTLAGDSVALNLASFTAAGTTQSAHALDLSAADGATNGGLLYASGALTLAGTGFANTGEVSGASSTVQLGTLSNGGLFTGARDAAGAMTVAASEFRNTGTFQSAGGIALSLGRTLDNHGDVIAMGRIDVHGSSGVLTIANGSDATLASDRAARIQAGLGLTISATDLAASVVLASNIGAISGNGVALDLASLGNGGVIQSAGEAEIRAAGALGNAGTIVSTMTLNLTAGSLENSGGIQGAKGSMLTIGGTLANKAGKIVLSADRSAAGTITAGSISNSGVIQASGDATLFTATLANSGDLYAGGALSLIGNGLAVTNSGADATIQAIGALRIGPASGTPALLSIAGGVVYGGTVTLDLGSFSNAGWLQSVDTLTLAANSAVNTGTLLALGQTGITTGTLTNAGTLEGRGATAITARALTNRGVLIASRTATVAGTITAQVLQNDRGATVYGAGPLALLVDTDLTNSGTIFTDAALDVHALAGAGLRLNTMGRDALISSGGRMTLGTAERAIDYHSDTGSQLIAGGDAVIQATRYRNDGLTQSNGALSLTATNVDNNGTTLAKTGLQAAVANGLNNHGTIQGRVATITAGQVENAGTLSLATETGATGQLSATAVLNRGWIQSAGGIRLAVGRLLDNDGKLLAGRDVQLLQAGSDRLDVRLRANSVVQAGGRVAIDLPALDLVQDGILAADLIDLKLGSFSNSGTVQSVHDTRFELATGPLRNSGTLYVGGRALVRAESFINTAGAQVQAIEGLDAQLSGSLDNRGFVLAGRDAANAVPARAAELRVTAAMIANAGTLRAVGREQLAASARLSNSGTLYAGTDLSIAGTSSTATILDNTGTMYAAGRLDIINRGNAAIRFENDTAKGTIRARDLDITLATLVNAGTLQGDRGGVLSIGNVLTNAASGIIYLGSMSTGEGTISAGSLTNSGYVQGLGALALNISGDVTNGASGAILAGGNLTLSGTAGSSDLLNYGIVQSNGQLKITGGGDTRFGSITFAGSSAKLLAGTASIKATALSLDAGNALTASGLVAIDTTTLNLSTATSRIIAGPGNSSVTVGSVFTNNGALYASGNLTVGAPDITNADGAALAAGGTLTLNSSNDIQNYATIFANDLTATASNEFHNYEGGKIDATHDATITAATFENNYLVNVTHDLTIEADTVLNQITGGDTRYWNYEGTGFDPSYRPGTTGDDDHDPRTGADGEYGDQSKQEVRGPNMDYDNPALKNMSISAAVKDTWKSTKTGSDIEISGDFSWKYSATFDTRQYYRGGKPTGTKPQLLANNRLTIQNFDTAKNLGGTISAPILTFVTERTGATLLNDALAVKVQHWGAAWNHYRNCDTQFLGCGWTYFRSYNKWINSAEVSDSIGATIAGSTVTISGVALTNIDGVDQRNGTTASAVAQATTRSGDGTSSLNGGAGAVTATGSAGQVGLTALQGTSAGESATASFTGVVARNAVAFGGALSGVTDKSLQNGKAAAISGVAAPVDTTGLAAGVAGGGELIATTDRNIGAVLEQAIAVRAAANAANQPASPLQAITASNGAVALTFSGVTIPLPTSPNERYVTTQDPKAGYLIESNPLYAVGSPTLGSEFIAQRLGLNPDTLLRRLGDAAYETFLVTQQIVAQAGTAAIVRAETSEQQYARLMEQGVTQAGSMGLTYGRALTDAQAASLKQDLVWMIETDVGGQRVVAPVVYLSAATKAMFNAGGANIAGDDLKMDATSVTNTGGSISGSRSLAIKSTGDVTNTSGQITGGNVSVTSTNGSIVNQTFTFATGNDQNGATQIGKTATITATGALSLDAAKDVTSLGGKIGAGTDASIKAGRDIIFGKIENKTMTTSADGKDSSTTIEQIGSALDVDRNLTMSSGNDTTLKASTANVGGNASITTGGNFNILAGQNSKETSATSEKSGMGVGGGVYGTEKATTTTFTGRNVASGLNVGGNANIAATGDMTVQGSNVNIGGNADVAAGSINILQGNDVDRSSTTTDTTTYLRTSGSGSTSTGAEAKADASSKGYVNQASANAGASAGATGKGDLELMNNTKTTTDEEHSRAVGSTFNVGGNASLNAKNDVTLQGSSLDAGGDVNVNATNVNLRAAENKDTKTTTSTSTSLGLMTESNNKAGVDASASASQNFTMQANAGVGAEAESDNTVDLVRNTQEQTKQTDITHTGSSIKSGGNTALNASNKLSVQGSSVDAAGDVDLKAKDMSFEAVNDVHETTTETQQTRAGLYANGNAEAKAGAQANVMGAQAGASAGAEASAGINISHSSGSSTEGSTTAVTSSIKSGGNMTRTAEGKITDQGTQIEAGGNFNQSATEWESKAAGDTTYSSSSSQTDTARIGAYADADAGASTGVGAGGGTGVDAGASAGGKITYSHEDTNSSADSSTARTSTIKTGGGFASTTTGKTTMEGTNVEAGSDASLTAGSLDYQAAHNTQSSSSTSNTGEASAKVGIDATKAVKVELEGSYSGEQGSASASQAVTGGISSGGNLSVKTTRGDANFEGTKLNAAGSGSIDSAGSVNMNAARDTSTSSTDSQNASLGISATKGAGGVEAGGGFSHEKEDSSTAQAGAFTTGNGLSVKANNDASFEGTALSSGAGGTDVKAGGDATFKAAENTHTTEAYGAEISLSAEASKSEKPAGDTKPAAGGDKPTIGSHREQGTSGDGSDAGWQPAKPSGGTDSGKPSGPTIGGNRGQTDAASGGGGWKGARPSSTDTNGTVPTIGGNRTDPASGGALGTDGAGWQSARPSTGGNPGGSTIGGNRSESGPGPADGNPGGAGRWQSAQPSTGTQPGGSVKIGDSRDAAPPAPKTSGWQSATPTKATEPAAPAAPAAPAEPAMLKAPSKPSGIVPTAPDAPLNKTGSAGGSVNVSSSSQTTYTGPTLQSGGAVTVSAGGNVTNQNVTTNAGGGTTTTAGGHVTNTTVKDSNTQSSYGGSVKGQTSEANAGTGNTDAGTQQVP